MGIRRFCDQCGNTVQEFTVLSYGGVRELVEKQEAIQQSLHAMRAQGMGNGGASGGGGGGVGSLAAQHLPTMPAKPHTPIIDVELCQHCAPIWMDRVAKLTKQSDV